MSYDSNNPKSVTLSDEYAFDDKHDIIKKLNGLVSGNVSLNSSVSLENELDNLPITIYNRKGVTVVDLSKAKINIKVGLFFKPFGGRVKSIEISRDVITIINDGFWNVNIPVKR